MAHLKVKLLTSNEAEDQSARGTMRQVVSESMCLLIQNGRELHKERQRRHIVQMIPRVVTIVANPLLIHLPHDWSRWALLISDSYHTKKYFSKLSVDSKAVVQLFVVVCKRGSCAKGPSNEQFLPF
jgi:hypothetical protein